MEDTVSSETENPYEIVGNAGPQRTPRGFTEPRAVLGFMLVGFVFALLALPFLYVASRMRTDAWIQMLFPGLAWGGALWVAISRYIGPMTGARRIGLITGCLLSFLICGGIYEVTIPGNWFVEQPWSWKLLRPYVLSATVSFAGFVATVRLTGGPVPASMLAVLWLAGSLLCFGTLFVIDELGYRRDWLPIDVVTLICANVLQVGILGLVGWQLAAAHSSFSNQSPSGTTA